MTLENLLMKESDAVLLDIYKELESYKIPATGYAHAYCRKVNRMIDKGTLCVIPDKYRKVYLPTLSKAIFKEMSRRYFEFCLNQKAGYHAQLTMYEELTSNCEPEVETATCAWCGEDFESGDLYDTDLGKLCERCIIAIRSRGEKITVFE